MALSRLGPASGVEVAVFPPCLHITQVVDGLKGKSVRSARRTLRWKPMQGALTGEIGTESVG